AVARDAGVVPGGSGTGLRLRASRSATPVRPRRVGAAAVVVPVRKRGAADRRPTDGRAALGLGAVAPLVARRADTGARARRLPERAPVRADPAGSAVDGAGICERLRVRAAHRAGHRDAGRT